MGAATDTSPAFRIPLRPLAAHHRSMVVLALGVVLLTDVLRVMLPSLITLFGRAGDTPPERMGLFAALWFLLPFAAAPLARRWGARPVALGGAALLVADRLALQAADGGAPQLYLAGAGVGFGLVFLYGCALRLPRRTVPAGLAAGMAASATAHLALDQVDLVWRDGVLPWLPVLAVGAAFLRLAWAAPAPGDPAPPGVWFAFGPALALHGMYLATLGLAEHPGGEQGGPWRIAVVAAALVCAQFVMVSYAARPPYRRWVVVVLLPAAVAALAVSSALPFALFAAVALGGCLGMAALPATSPASARRGGIALLGGALVFLIAVFLYYAAYDADLGFPNGVVPVLLAGTVAAIAAAAARGRAVQHLARPRPRAVVVAALVTAAAVAALTWRPLPETRPIPRSEFTLIAYNIRMGFGLKGTLDLDRIAAWARAERPDVVLLSEVDRGWLLNGGHDDLARIARGLGMRYHFAPAADPLWGDAIITDLPVRQVVSHPLGRHDHPTGAQAQAAVVEVAGRQVGIVGTHLQAPPGQAPEVAAVVRDLGGGRPVLLAGDLNTRPGDPAMRVLSAAGLSDPLTGLGDPLTSPADAPVERIDHVLVGPGLAVTAARAPGVEFSDHRPLVVRLRVTGV
ncbi:endonuclease/exonuclease/phosphatase family protein [Sphaerisporangium rhizosphaerae]|uniref:Endonuclease/exonuclease/phosphatase family protein n=1 Tax=Sphaerisporangium rhizosphaerae TaxID=2269375 RepID=A0ABW2NXE2_9ACTN